MRPAAAWQTEPAFRSPGEQRPGFRWTLLQRHGKRPFLLLARLLLRADNRCAGLAWWSELAILETAGGRYALALRHGAACPRQQPWTDAWLCDTADAARRALAAHNPAWALPAEDGSVSPAAADRFRGAWAGLLAAATGHRP